VKRPHRLTAFRLNPKETRIIGYLLVSYSELELEMCRCLSEMLHGDRMLAVTLMFRLRGEENRLQIIDAVLRPQFQTLQLLTEYDKIFSALKRVKDIRNQYAHCQWDHTKKKGVLRFAKLEDIAKRNATKLTWRATNLALLEYQESFFHFTFVCLYLLRKEIKTKREGKTSTRLAAALQELTEPPLYNAPA